MFHFTATKVLYGVGDADYRYQFCRRSSDCKLRSAKLPLVTAHEAFFAPAEKL